MAIISVALKDTARPSLPTDDLVAVTLGAGIMMISLTAILVCMRIYVRKFVTNSLGADDYAMLAAFGFTLMTTVLIMILTRYGLGKHTWNVDVENNLEPYLKGFYLTIILYNVALGVLKIAILLQMYRIFNRQMRKICIGAMVVVSMWSGGLTLVSIFTCRPIDAFWDQSVHGYCIPNLPQWYINAAGNIATDLFIFALPIPVLWKLQLPSSQRYSLVGVFALGFFTCSISLIRLGFLNIKADPFHENVGGALWSEAEMCCGLIVSCLPALRPIFWRFVPHAIRSHSTHNRGASTLASGTGHHHHHRRNTLHKPPPSEKSLPSTLGKETAVVAVVEEVPRLPSMEKDVEAASSPGGASSSSGDSFGGKTAWPFGPKETTIQIHASGTPRNSAPNAEAIGFARGTQTTVSAARQSQMLSGGGQAGLAPGIIRVQTDVVMERDGIWDGGH